MRAGLQEELDQLEANLQETGDVVRRMLRGSVGALRDCDVELAGEVVAFDDEVDRRYAAIEDRIQTLLATQSPVAVDLRLVLAVLHVNLHLERIADYCVTIAKLNVLAEGLEADRYVLEAFDEMGARADEMLGIALDSFAARDAERAQTLTELDELIDRANRRLLDTVFEFAADPEKREWGLRMILVSRCLERIGDHAVDIGEQTAYLVTGELRQFTDASRAA